jgi:hypothetical protein
LLPTLVLVIPLLVTATVLYATTVHAGIATTCLIVALPIGLWATPWFNRSPGVVR